MTEHEYGPHSRGQSAASGTCPECGVPFGWNGLLCACPSPITVAVAAERARCAKIAEDIDVPEEYRGWRDDREPEGFFRARDAIAAKVRGGA